MSRLRSKPNVKKMLKCINTENNTGLQHANLWQNTKDKILFVLEKKQRGIELEKLSTAFEEEFGDWLIPSKFGFSDLVEMLKSLDDIVDIKLMQSNNQMLLFPKSGKVKDKIYLILVYSSLHLS